MPSIGTTEVFGCAAVPSVDATHAANGHRRSEMPSALTVKLRGLAEKRGASPTGSMPVVEP
eukprot:CAMPEP_0183362766 /NCGR_PEP_ID=MMETSP0164_2-20130417/71359_1 /TAXON_ID=221442 /ORGANISM="Coccolithus pelagicus ssp braarudi, Strain PLY182g" /LENGTH=60 /DNA_ID=CAMNT_0025537707 /DNA_START=211 /DNA_END=393 /DNA_ORIENTATION=-